MTMTAKHLQCAKEKKIHRSSGNVFADSGFPPEEAAHLLVRSDLMIRIEDLLKDRGLTQAKAAKLLGVTQPRISDIVRGRVELFSIDTLVDMLARLGVSVSIRMKRSRRIGDLSGLCPDPDRSPTA